jgi:hypothetical protein
MNATHNRRKILKSLSGSIMAAPFVSNAAAQSTKNQDITTSRIINIGIEHNIKDNTQDLAIANVDNIPADYNQNDTAILDSEMSDVKVENIEQNESLMSIENKAIPTSSKNIQLSELYHGVNMASIDTKIPSLFKTRALILEETYTPEAEINVHSNHINVETKWGKRTARDGNLIRIQLPKQSITVMKTKRGERIPEDQLVKGAVGKPYKTKLEKAEVTSEPYLLIQYNNKVDIKKIDDGGDNK